MKKPILSIAMIVKNESRCLERCLKALQPLRDAIPCEVVIADTGSTDGTRDIAEKYADIVFDFEWVNDFSAARNAAIARCSGEWCLNIDADEYLEPNVDQLVNFLTLDTNLEAAYVIIRNYFDPEMEGNYHDFQGARLFKMGVGIKYVTPIHEYIDTGDRPLMLLDQVVFLHDGYAFVTEEDAKRKEERNLKLLEVELAKDPSNLRRLNQCLESSAHFPWKQWQFAQDSMKIVMDNTGTGLFKFRESICRSCIQAVSGCGLPIIEEWCEWASNNISDTLYYKIDIPYMMCLYYMANKNYKKVLHWATHYKKGAKCVDDMDYATVLEETIVSPLRCNSKEQRVFMQLLAAESMVHLEMTDEAVDVLTHIKPKELLNIRMKDYFRIVSLLHENKKIRRHVSKLVSLIVESKEKKSDSHRSALKDYATAVFSDKEKSAWNIFSMCESTYMIPAKIMGASTEECGGLVYQIPNWEYVPNAVYEKLISEEISLPHEFYQQSVDELRSIATGIFLNEKEKLISRAMQWIYKLGEDVSLQQAQFAYYLAAVAAGHCKWENDNDIKVAKLFIEIGDAYIPALYHQTILEDQQLWSCMPVLHRFSLHLSSGMHALEINNELEWVRELRGALKAMPSFKLMIEYLQKHPPIITVNQEIKELAEKVQAILSQYDPDDPAVLAIKESPVYQKVAHLLIH